MSGYRIVLASGSPRRKEILGKLQTDFEVMVSNVEEITDETEPVEIVKALSKLKAEDIFGKIHDETEKIVVIGSDTVVAYKGEIMGKPKNREDAFRMIRQFAGDKHTVYSGVTIIIKNDEVKKITFGVGTDVEVDSMTDEEIYSYIDTGEPFDKAGAYAVQGLFAPYIKGIHGDYYNIVGFPIHDVYSVLKDEGVV